MVKKIRISKHRKDGPWQRYWVVANRIKKGILPFSRRVEIAGSLRRKKKYVNDIDIVAIPKNKDAIRDYFRNKGKIVRSGEDILSAEVNDIPVDIFFTSPKSYGAAMYYATGSGLANVGRRTFARNKGFLLNQRGLFDRKTGKYIAGKTEKEIMKILGREYKRPEDRG